jgi:outer membrane protein OmpA-like peptidoglycan-associated protein
MGVPASRGCRRAGAALVCLGLVASIACASGAPPGPQASAEPTQAAGSTGADDGVPTAAGGAAPQGASGLASAPAVPAPVDDAVARYLDEQARRVQDGVADASVQRQEDRLLVTLPGDAIFAPGSASLSPGGSDRLRALAETLNAYPETDVVVKGYTDAQGSEAFNLKLSEDRADRVREYLTSQGVSEARVKAIGFGPQFPVASNDTPEGRQQNRRLELELRADPSLRAHDVQGVAR